MTTGPQLITVPLPGRAQRIAEYGPADAAPSETVVMVHGLRGTWHGLDRLARSLPPNYRVLVPELPGFDGAPDLEGGNSIERYAGWLGDVTDAVGLTGHVVLGHSFGSIIVAARAQQPVRATILVNPVAVAAASGPHPFGSRGAALLYDIARSAPPAVGNWLLTSRIHVRAMSMMMAKTKDRDMRAWIHRQHDLHYSSYTSMEGVHRAFAESVARSVGEFAPRLSGPVLLIAGARDDIATPAAQRALADRIPSAELQMIPGVGHLIHYETPELAGGLIADYLARHGPQQIAG